MTRILPSLLLAAVGAGVTPPLLTAQSRLAIRVDPRIELLGTLQLLAGGGPTTTDIVFPYRERVEQRFRPFADHPAVTMFRRMARVGFAFDAPVIVMLHCSDPPALRLTGTLPPEIVQRAGGRDTLEAWVALVRQFAEESGFAGFAEENRTYYAGLAGEVERMLEPRLLEDLEAYYGMREDGYRIILSPLTKGGFGPRVEVAPGSWWVYAVASPAEYSADTLRFYTAAGLRTLIWHEFAHSFVNPLTESHWQELTAYHRLLDSIADGLPQWYRQWKPALDEHIVRAVTVRMAARYRSDSAGAAAMTREVNWGFTYVPAIADLLEDRYEKDRARWPTFSAFFPEIVALIRELAGSP